MEIQELTNKAAKLNNSGKKVEAFKLYSRAFDMLCDEAGAHAHKQPETFRDEKNNEGEKVRIVLPRLFDETKKYLKKDATAYIILKNMAVISHTLGDNDSAINALEQALELAPDSHDTSDAQTGLSKLKK